MANSKDLINELTYEERREVIDSCCDGCKGAMFLGYNEDCIYQCEGFAEAAREMIDLSKMGAA